MPTAVSGGGTWSYIAASRGGTSHTPYHTCGIKTNGTGYCWGYNFYGQLGNGSGGGSGHDAYTPSAISGGGTWETIVLGQLATCGIKTGGAGYCWGRKNSSSGESHTPQSVGSGFISMYMSSTTVYAAKASSVMVWTVDNGSTSYNSWSTSGSFVQIGYGTGLAADGSIYSFSESNPTPVKLLGAAVTFMDSADWLGTYSTDDCADPFAWSSKISEGDSITAYNTPGGCGSFTCQSEQRTCSGGVLSGSYQYEDCTAGLSMGGYCWILGGKGHNCNAECAGLGGCDVNGLIAYGSSGTDSACNSLISALNGSSVSQNSSASGTSGCVLTSGKSKRRTTTTTCSGYGSSSYRACSCNF